MHEDVEDELVRLLASEIERTIDLEVKKAIGMIPTELRYGQKAYIPYTGLDGLERGEVCELQWLNNIKRCSKKKLGFSRRFPFLKCEVVFYTDVVLNSGTDMYPKWKHIYALESPAAMAKKFGIEYNDTVVELMKDQLEHGDK